MDGFDTIIVGAGAAGCVLAARLTEDPAREVLLVEAGPSDEGVAAIRDPARWTSLIGGALDWGYSYAASPHLGGREVAIPRGRVLGGCSSTNALLWYRGHPDDYDDWSGQGADGWDFAAVLPFFRRSEDWQGGANRWRGAGGPMRLERPADPHPAALALLEAAPAFGIPRIADANGASNEGACLADLTMRAGRRCSTADAYLRPALGRPNLHLRTGAEVARLRLEGGRCRGIDCLVDGSVEAVEASGEVVLCAGAIGSPLLLIRSGIGPDDDLRRLGIPTQICLPVGHNLQDHPLIGHVTFRAAAPMGPVRDNGGGSMMNWRSQPGRGRPDLHAVVAQGPDRFGLSPGLMGSTSRGFLRLHPQGVEIQPNLLAERADVEALMDGVALCFEMGLGPHFRALAAGPVSPPPLDRSGLEAFVRASCSSFFHPCGTCRMGTGKDSVVDPVLRVHGMDGLRVVDASVMPSIPSCNTLAPTVMIAERAAVLMRAGRPAELSHA